MPAHPSPGTASATHWAWPWTAWDRWEREGFGEACRVPSCVSSCVSPRLASSTRLRTLKKQLAQASHAYGTHKPQFRLALAGAGPAARQQAASGADAVPGRKGGLTDKKGFVFHYKVVNRPYRRQATVLHLLSAVHFKDGSAEEEACARAVLQRAVAAGVSVDQGVTLIRINGQRLGDRVSPLLLAANRGQLLALKLLLAAGADARWVEAACALRAHALRPPPCGQLTDSCLQCRRRTENHSIAWYALGSGHLDCVGSLLDAGFTPSDLLLDVAGQARLPLLAASQGGCKGCRGSCQLCSRTTTHPPPTLFVSSPY